MNREEKKCHLVQAKLTATQNRRLLELAGSYQMKKGELIRMLIDNEYNCFKFVRIDETEFEMKQ
jgi:hypothetical protein